MRADKAFRLSEFLFGIAGWLRRQRHRSTVDAAQIAAPLAMIGMPGQSARRQTAQRPSAPLPAPTSAVPAIALTQSSIVVVPLPSGLGWSNDAIGRAIVEDDVLEQDAPTGLTDTATAFGDDATAALVAAVLDAEPHTFTNADAAAPSSEPLLAKAPALVRAPLLLARQLRGVARLNHPSERRQNGKKQPVRRSSARPAAPSRRAAAKRNLVKAPKAQAWILSRATSR